MTPESLAAYRAHLEASNGSRLTPRALRELFDHIDEITRQRDEARAELTDEIEWGIGCPEGNGTTWYQGNFTQRGARHHANQRGDGHFPAWRRLTNWHRADDTKDSV